MKSLKKATGWIIAGVAALLIIVAATSATPLFRLVMPALS